MPPLGNRLGGVATMAVVTLSLASLADVPAATIDSLERADEQLSYEIAYVIADQAIDRSAIGS